MAGAWNAGLWPPVPRSCQGPERPAETSIRFCVIPTTRAFLALLAVMEIAPGRTPGSGVAGCPSTGTFHSDVWSPAPLSTSRSSASYQVNAIGLVRFGPSCTDGPMYVCWNGLADWPGPGLPLSMAANPSAGECGVEDQVGRASATHLTQAVPNRVEFG